jgi:kumamolisin
MASAQGAHKSLTLSIKGSTRRPLPDARLIAPADPAQKIRVSVYARQNLAAAVQRSSVTEQLASQWPRQRQYLSGATFDAVFGADSDEIARIAKWARSKGLTVVDTNVSSRRVLLEGPIGSVNAAFGTTLNEYDHPTLGHFRGREGALYVDDDVSELIEGVFGLDTRRVGHPRFRRLATAPLALPSPGPARTSKQRKPAARQVLPPTQWPGTFFPPQVGALYDYPAQLTGRQQNVGVFAFNGGSTPDPRGGYNLEALTAYFTNVLGGQPPSIQDVVIQGPGNDPGPDTPASERRGDATGEVMLDLCVVGSLVPDARIFVYFTEFTTQGWVDALHAAITDNNNISVISISYGNPEDDPQGLWTTMGVKVVDQALQAAVAKGITICVASGDDGSSDQEPTGAHVDFPASSPHVLAVGGTKLVVKGATLKETVWNEVRINEGAGGGGVSVIFSKPDYQTGTDIPSAADPPHTVGRGVPDVAAVSDPVTGVVIMHVSGNHLEPIGGTSAAAPLWASLIARINQGLNARCGFLNTLLYTKLNKGVLRDITVGSNGAYSAKAGWDACTGFGAPGGASLLKALSAAPKAASKSKSKSKRS